MVAGVATAVAVLAGALLVGSSVRASLRDLVTERMGRANYVATSAHFFREQLGAESGGCPLVVLEGAVTNAASHRRAGGVSVYGVDERFWRFQGWPAAEGVLATAALLREVGEGELLIRLEKPSAIPKESLHGRKDEGKTIRVSPSRAAHEFSLKAQQGDVLAVYLPLKRLQRELGTAGGVNALLFGGNAAPDVASHVTLGDLGIRVRAISSGGLAVESDTAIVSDALAEAVGGAGRPVFSYLANSLRVGGKEVPYSLVTAVDPRLMPVAKGSVVLNDWAARELSAKVGDSLEMRYFVWGDGGNLLTRSSSFRVSEIDAIHGLAADRELTPEYPGITEAKTIRDWDPPFPMDLSRIGARDEAYWNQYRTTPKAFFAIEDGERMWGSRFGRMTSLRVPDGDVATEEKALRSRVEPSRFGLGVYPARSAGLEGARGSTDFGEYFTYFSFFLVASAALLAGLFFRLGVEQRYREIGALQALGWRMSRVRRELLAEGLVLAVGGSGLGVLGGIGYCAFVLYGLRTWWRGAVGTSALHLHVDVESLVVGVAGGVLIAVAVIWLSMRSISKVSARALLSGDGGARGGRGSRRWTIWVAAAMGLGALGMAGAGITKAVSASESFFGAGMMLLIASLMFVSVRLRRVRGGIEQSPSLWRLGLRNASYRPGRSVLAIALIASAVFLLVALDAFRESGGSAGTGGFSLMAESQLPIFWDPNSPAGRESLNMSAIEGKLKGVRFYPFRLWPGDDASCLNLYEPRNPRVLGARAEFVKLGRFSFGDTAAKSAAEKANPWLLLEDDPGSEVTPAIADANSITYVLHRKVGDELVVAGHRLKLVAALAGSVLQSELIVSEQNFVKLFPEEQGYRVFLIDAQRGGVGDALEDALSDYGFDATTTAERLAGYHRVENTYLSTFQALGALGLLLGTVGLAAVLLRNVLERRREMALLGALGFRRDQLGWLVLAENAFLVACGVGIGALCAAVAVAPAALERGAGAPFGALLVLVGAVPLTALVSSVLAIRVVRRMPLLESLRAE